LSEAISREIWPAEHAVLMRPERLRYVRKMIKPKGCVFCAAASAGAGFGKLVLYRGKRAMAVLNKFPYNNGHLLILPTRHGGDFNKLDEKEHRDLHRLLRESVGFIRKAYECPGINVGLNLGEAAGAGIPDHLHYHVVPRWRGDTNFFPLIAETKVVVETLEQTFERLLPYYQSLK
jgi:ATP adenylyltransferase